MKEPATGWTCQCGRFVLSSAHERLVASTPAAPAGGQRGREHSAHAKARRGTATRQPGGAFRMESGREVWAASPCSTALSTAMFALVLRLASEAVEAPERLLALAANPRRAPALEALFNRARIFPDRCPELAALCHMSRATFIRQFQQRLGRSAAEAADGYPHDLWRRTEITIDRPRRPRAQSPTGSDTSRMPHSSAPSNSISG